MFDPLKVLYLVYLYQFYVVFIYENFYKVNKATGLGLGLELGLGSNFSFPYHLLVMCKW